MENLLTIDASAASHVGMVQAVNTDNFYLNGRYIHDYETDSIQASVENSGSEYLFAISDSMDEASEDKNTSISAVKELKKLQEKYKTSSKDLQSKLENLKESAQELSNLIYSMTLGSNEEVVRKPAITGLLLSRNCAGVISMGSCRAYLYRGGTLKQLVSDSKKAERLLKMGIITSDQAEMLKVSGEGGKKDSQKYEIIDIRTGDVFLLCSNGVTDLVEEDDLAQIVSMDENASELAARIIRRTMKNGGNDCVTALVVKVKKAESDKNAQEIQLPKAKSRATAPAGRNNTLSRKKLLMKKYISAAFSILIIGLLVFGVWKLSTNNKHKDPDSVSLGTAHQTTYETTVSGTSMETTGKSIQSGTADGANSDANSQQSGEKTYTVRPGDNLSKISKKFYNDINKYTLIMEANDIKDPSKIAIGQVLKIPSIAEP